MAAVSAVLSLIFGCVISSTFAIVFFSARHVWHRLFSDDEAVGVLVSSVLPITVAFMVCCSFTSKSAHKQTADGGQCVLSGVCRGVGRQTIGAVLNLIGYYVLGMPIAIILARVVGMGLPGQWIGLMVAGWSVFIAYSIFLVKSDWSALSQNAIDRNTASGLDIQVIEEDLDQTNTETNTEMTRM